MLNKIYMEIDKLNSSDNLQHISQMFTDLYQNSMYHCVCKVIIND
jgi:hypothetical protein